jgi:hypothetical protein
VHNLQETNKKHKKVFAMPGKPVIEKIFEYWMTIQLFETCCGFASFAFGFELSALSSSGVSGVRNLL